MFLPGRRTLLIGGGVIAVALLIRSSPAARGAITSAAFRGILPARSAPYADLLLAAGAKYRISPLLLWAVMEVESASGTQLVPAGPAGTNASGDDVGLMQINRRAHPEFTTKLAPDGTPLWTKPKANIDYGAFVLRSYADQLARAGVPKIELLLAALAAYNAGPGNVLRARAEGRDLTTVTAAPWYLPKMIDTLRAAEALLAGSAPTRLGALQRRAA